MSTLTASSPPICARCNRPHDEHVVVTFMAANTYEPRWRCVRICPTALYHPLSPEAPPEVEGWTEPAKSETK